MKKTSLFKTLVVVLMGGVVAASCNEKETDVQKNLPEIADIQIAPGAEGTVEFYAYDSWTITSDKEWCTFDPQSGDKGDNTVAYSIADDFAAAESATVTLSIGSDNVSFRISRTEKARTFSITDAAGAAVSALVFGEDAKSYTVKVSGNFEWELPVDQFPGWLTAPAAAVNGVLNSESGLYEASLTLAVNESEISNYYESKTATMTFEALDDLNWSADLALSHTFEKPAFVGRLAAEGFGSEITIDLAGNIVGLSGENKKSLDFTLTPAAGEQNFVAFYISQYEIEGSEGLNIDPLPSGSNANGTPHQWFKLALKEGTTYTLTIENYPAKLDMGQSGVKVFKTGYVCFFPDAITGSWAQKDPNVAMWYVFNFAITSTDILSETYLPYLIKINVEQPE